MKRALADLPSRGRGYILVVLAAASLVALLAATRVALAPPTAREFALAMALLVAVGAVSVRAPSLLWGGRRIAIHPDEALIYLGFVFLPAPLVILAVLFAGIAAQASARKPWVKVAFNASAHALATGAGAVAVFAAGRAGVAPTEAALLAPLVVSAVGQLVVALLLTRLAGERWRAAIRPDLGTSIAISGIAGTTLGALAVALFRWHPLATIALLPVAFLAARVLALEYRHRNELSARRALATASARFACDGTEEAALDTARHVCFDLFDLSRCAVRLHGSRSRAWVRPGALGREVTIATTLMATGGEPLGELEVVVASKTRARIVEDKELLDLVGGYLAMALGSARAAEARRRSAQLIVLQDLVKGIAHEINNPVMYASGALEMAELDASDPEIDRAHLLQMLEVGRRGLARITTISRALADVSRAGQSPAAQFDVQALAGAVAAQHGIHAEHGSEPIVVRGNAEDLHTALAVLARNAVEAQGASPPRLSIRRVGEEAEVSVIDSGAGVSAEDKPHLFAPFFTTKPDGVGLSLATALRIVRDHGGDIAHEESPGGGACFRLRIPALPTIVVSSARPARRENA